MGGCCFKPSPEATDTNPSASQGAGGSGATGREGRSGGRSGDGPGPGNKTLCRKPPTWTAEAPMTKGQLLSKRDEFWDTAPAFVGRAEIWQAIRAAAECEDMETAQAIMSAVDVTLPQGNLSVVYDELGNKYDIPPYCLSEPSNMVNDSGEGGGESAEANNAANESSDQTSQLKVRFRLNTGKEIPWNGPASTTIKELKGFIQTEEGIAPDRQRWLYGGQMLTDAQTLTAAKVVNDSVVQLMIRPEDA